MVAATQPSSPGAVDPVDQWGLDSFPASDPPPWWAGLADVKEVHMTSPDDIARKAAELATRADRDAAVAELVALAGHQRQPLEQATSTFIARLHRRSDDYEATHALRLLHRALDTVGWQAAAAPASQHQPAGVTDRIMRLLRGRRRPAAERPSPQPATA